MTAFVTAPFSNSTGSIAGVSTLPTPRLGAGPAAGAAFAELLGEARETTKPTPTEGVDAAIPLAQLMDMFIMLEILGLPAPRWMIDAFRARGMGGLADSIEARNVRLEAERVEQLREQRRIELGLK